MLAFWLVHYNCPHRTPGERRKETKMRKFWRAFRWVLLAVFVLFGALAIFFLVTEYKPASEEKILVAGKGAALSKGEEISLVSWNVGFCALGDNTDFFMDGGKNVFTADKARVQENIRGILNTLKKQDPDIVLLQEVDEDSARSHNINAAEMFKETWPDYAGTFAYNLKVAFLPYPIPPLGKVQSGIQTLSKYSVTDATRIQLPIPFKWPVSVFNLKRCLLVNRIPVEEKELVVVNLHLEAYDSGEGKIAQTKMLRDFLEAEIAKGNYVIAGGDFNQTFSNVDASRFSAQEGKWQPGIIERSDFSDKWTFLMDGAVPSCRSLDQVYEGADKESFQYYVIDGFIVSSNIQVESFEVIDEDFKNSDHNPVKLTIRLA